LLSDFFFQAEDGIRDRNVTGVQTCALPILPRRRSIFQIRSCRFSPRPAATPAVATAKPVAKTDSSFPCSVLNPPKTTNISLKRRSEERRVGKECRAGWWSDDDEGRHSK